MDIGIFKRQVQSFLVVALSAYDRFRNESTVNRLCHHIDNRVALENPVRLVEYFARLSASRWEDELTLSADFNDIEFSVPIQGWSAAFPFNKVNLKRPGALARVETYLKRAPKALFDAKMAGIMETFRRNVLTVDGQEFFSDAHKHPLNDAGYDNIIQLPFADPANPTDEEIVRFFDKVQERLRINNSIEAEVIDVVEFTSSLLVTVHNSRHATAFQARTRATKTGRRCR